MAAQQQMPDWLTSAMGIGSGLGAAGGGLYNLLNKPPNPADAANKYISQIPGQTQQYYSPYMQAGKGSMEELQNQYKDLIGGNVQGRLGESYQASPGYQLRLKEALGAAGNAAAAGGGLGTPMHQGRAEETALKLSGEDYQNYINNQMNLYGLGLKGNERLNQMGFQANQDYANTIANTLGQQGAYSYSGQAGQNQAKSDAWGNIFSGLGMAAGSFAGGPIGAAAGGALGKWAGKYF
jgi:hypothetical protein